MARRKTQSPLLIFHPQKSKRLPWSSLPLGTQVSFLSYGLLAIVVCIAAAQLSFQTGNAIGISVTLAVTAALIAFVALRFRKWWFRRKWLEGLQMSQIDRMTGHEFEETCGEIYRRLGYQVEVTQRTRDQGADLVLVGKGERVVVQTKRQEGRVGNSAVQEIVAAKGFYGATRAIVVTNSTFAPAALALARANGVDLLGRNELAKLLARAKKQRSDVGEITSDSTEQL